MWISSFFSYFFIAIAIWLDNFSAPLLSLCFCFNQFQPAFLLIGLWIRPVCHAKLMKPGFEAMEITGIDRGVFFDLDFHTIPFHGDDALVQKHYVFKRSRKQKGI
jgi:hypothetical protein